MATTPIEPAPEPEKVTFTEASLPEEPKSDVQLTLPDGMVLRERIRRMDHNHGTSFTVTHTRLDTDGNVMTNSNGEPLISFTHEVAFMGEAAASLGAQGIADELLAGREVAACRAQAHFKGLEALDAIMLDRVG